jgi:hypothetical protein
MLIFCIESDSADFLIDYLEVIPASLVYFLLELFFLLGEDDLTIIESSPFIELVTYEPVTSINL